MKKNLVVGILRETKPSEYRTPLTPQDVNWLFRQGISVEVESDPKRIFRDHDYERKGAKVLKRIQKATLLLSIKNPLTSRLRKHKIYMAFSHTGKGQAENMPFLATCLKKNTTLIDFEKITDPDGKRLVYFGRFAGICGTVDSLHYLGKKLEWKGMKNPFRALMPAHQYTSLKALKEAMTKIGKKIRRGGMDKKLFPFIIGLTGHGNVARGVGEMLDLLKPIELHPKELKQLMRHSKKRPHQLFKTVFRREENFRAKEGRAFYFEDYLKNPREFESNLDVYLPFLSLFLQTSYWEKGSPRMITKKMVQDLARRKTFRLEFIGDISCDVRGSIEFTHKTTTAENPTFTFISSKRSFVDGYQGNGVTVLAIDNLPAELPRGASREFSRLIRGYVYQIASQGRRNLTLFETFPEEIRRAIITQGGKLGKNFQYLKKYIRV